MSRQRHGAEGARWHKFKQLVYATYGDSCVVCLHGGARAVDHVIPLTERPDLVFSLANCRPIHDDKSRCPVCQQNCNSVKAGMSLERARRIISERIAAQDAGRRTEARTPPQVPKYRDKGRPW